MSILSTTRIALSHRFDEPEHGLGPMSRFICCLRRFHVGETRLLPILSLRIGIEQKYVLRKGEIRRNDMKIDVGRILVLATKARRPMPRSHDPSPAPISTPSEVLTRVFMIGLLWSLKDSEFSAALHKTKVYNSEVLIDLSVLHSVIVGVAACCFLIAFPAHL